MSDIETNAARKSSGLRAIADGLGVNPDLLVAQKVIRDAADKIEELERERDEAREKAERYRLEANAFMMQRDALVQKLDAWQEIAEHLHHLVQHPAYGVDQAIRRLDVLAAYKHLNNEH